MPQKISKEYKGARRFIFLQQVAQQRIVTTVNCYTKLLRITISDFYVNI